MALVAGCWCCWGLVLYTDLSKFFLTYLSAPAPAPPGLLLVVAWLLLNPWWMWGCCYFI